MKMLKNASIKNVQKCFLRAIRSGCGLTVDCAEDSEAGAEASPEATGAAINSLKFR
jgi:hypothetical protein